jgi:hypothetical protein
VAYFTRIFVQYTLPNYLVPIGIILWTHFRKAEPPVLQVGRTIVRNCV